MKLESVALASIVLITPPAYAQTLPDGALAEMERSLREHYRNRGLEIRDLKMYSRPGNEASGFGKIYRDGRQLGAVRCQGLFNSSTRETLARCDD